MPIARAHGQHDAELVGEVRVGQDGTSGERWAWQHLLAIPQPGHTDGPRVEASDMANQQELGWTRCMSEDGGHGWLWVKVKARVRENPSRDITWSL